MNRKQLKPPHTSASGNGSDAADVSERQTTEPSSATSEAALHKPAYAFLRYKDVAQAEQNGMESATESKASDEGSSPAPVEEQQPRPPGPAASPPPVDGGVVCWLQVVGAFGTWTNVGGDACDVC
jgi:hypothetical protein